MKTHKVAGGGGVGLHVVEAGNPGGRPVLFIHGISQCSLAWSRQLDSELARDHRLVAMDLRGHGLSDKPRDAYGDSRLWADDVRAVIDTLDLNRPVLSGWSYRLAGLSGLHPALRRGPDWRPPFCRWRDEAWQRCGDVRDQARVPGLRARSFCDGCGGERSDTRILPADLLQSGAVGERSVLILGYNASVPPHVRQAMLSRVIDNDDLLPRIRKPALITQSPKDAFLRPEIADQHKAGIAHAEIHVPNTGHTPFWEDAPAFNQRLRAFVETCSAATTAKVGHRLANDSR